VDVKRWEVWKERLPKFHIWERDFAEKKSKGRVKRNFIIERKGNEKGVI